MATTWRIVYHWDDETIKKEKREFSLTDEIMELINSWWGWGAINWVKVNWQVVNPDQAWYVWLTIPWVINNLSSNSTSDALSAKQWKVLYEYIQALQHVWHFLALWNTATWLPVTNPETSPYNYNTWDYYIVSNVAAGSWTNYKPNGSSYTINVASTTVESWDVQVNDIYFYDWYERRLLDNSWWGSSIAVDSSLSTTSTNPVQNAVITNRLNQMALDANTKTFWLTNLQDTTTWQAIRDWVDGGWNAIVYYSWMPYFVTAKSATRITLYSKFTGTQNSPSNQSTGFTEQLMWIDNNNNTITISNTAVWLWAPYLATNQNYATAYTPLYDGSPATKKYVDDKFSAVPVYTAGSNIDITSNQISTIRNWYVYVTCNDAASTKAKTGTSAEGNYTPQEWDLIMIHFVNWCAVWWPTIAIDWWSAIPFYIWVDGANAGNLYFGSTNVSKMFIYTNGRLVWDAVKDTNNAYSAWTGLALSNWVFSNTQPWPTVSSTAPANPSEWQLWYDTTNDVLKVYDWTNWNEVGGSIDTSNVKAFFLEDDEDTTAAAEILERVAEWRSEEVYRYPIIYMGGDTYLPSAGQALRWTSTMTIRFINVEPERDVIGYSRTELSQSTIEISWTIDTETFAVSGVTITTETNILWDFLEAKSWWTYITPRTPTYDWDPTTKKYVDDKVSWAISKWTTAPSNPVEWQLWYDTTNDVLKSYDWTNWNVVWDDDADINTKTFFVAATQAPVRSENMSFEINDTTPLQNAVDWIAEWNEALIDVNFVLDWESSSQHRTVLTFSWRTDEDDARTYTFSNAVGRNWATTAMALLINCTESWWEYAVNNASCFVSNTHYLATDNTTSYTPTWDYNPATKKYVDDTVWWAISKWTTAPSNPVEWQLWYDTTNDALKVYNWTAWVAVWWSGWVDIKNVTVATAYNTAAKVWTTTAWNYTPTAWDLLMVNFVNWCSVASPTLNIDGSWAKNIRTGNASATTSTLALWSTSNSNIKMLMYYDGTYYRTWSTSNNTYSGMSQSTASTGTSTTSSLISAKVLNDTIKEKAITLDPNSPLDVTTIWAGTESQYNNLSSKWATTAYLCVEE